LWYSEEVRIFLRSTNPDIERALLSLPRQNHEDLIQKYEQTFKKLSGKEINTELILKITTFSTFLRRIGPMLENFKTMAKNMINNRQTHNEQFGVFTNYLMPEYEKNCLAE